jgi:hypothetical protein
MCTYGIIGDFVSLFECKWRINADELNCDLEKVEKRLENLEKSKKNKNPKNFNKNI